MKLRITSDKINCTVEIDDPPWMNDTFGHTTSKEENEYITAQLDKIGKILWFELSYKYEVV